MSGRHYADGCFGICFKTPTDIWNQTQVLLNKCVVLSVLILKRSTEMCHNNVTQFPGDVSGANPRNVM
jgi:hypothetical protein